MPLAPIANVDASHDDRDDGHGDGDVRAAPICEDYVGHATTTRETRHDAASGAPTMSKCYLFATNSKMQTVRRSKPTHAPCAKVVERYMQRVEAAAVRVGCSLGMVERGEQQVDVGVLRLQGGRYVKRWTAPRGRRANLVRCVWMAKMSEASVELEFQLFHDYEHAAEA